MGIEAQMEQRVRVLLVDDDRDDYLLTQELFAGMDPQRYEMDWVADYASALKSIERDEHHVVVLDDRLGGENGLEQLRDAVAKSSKDPAILLSGHGERALDTEALQAGAVDYLDKGRLDVATLDRSIRHALQRKRDQQAFEQREHERTGELSRSGPQLRQLAAEMSDSDRHKNDFLAMLAHELRNPLAPMRNSVQILQLRAHDADAVRSAAEVMERQIGQMTRLVDELLEIDRITRGKIELHREQVDLVALVNQVVEAAEAQIQCVNHDVNVALPWDPLYVNADPIRLAEIIGNLLNNACKFTPKGGFISLSVEQEGELAAIQVRDNGIGIAAEHLPRIFDMFMQIDTSLERSNSGVGVGLTLVKTLVDMHGGTLDVRSGGVGQGSEFTVRLPVFVERRKPAMPEPAHASATLPRRILVVDDNQDAASSLAALLKLTGHETQTAYDGPEALLAAATFKPDVALLDIGLPNLNGFEVARQIRAQSWGKDTMLIALTGWGQDEDRLRSGESGFDAHLIKPADFSALQKLLTEANAG